MDFWVFAYGSLMWRPDFEFTEVQTARVRGWHRAMCILSTIYRGRPERPGLVLGLDRGGSCLGRAFRIEAHAVERVKALLHEREMPTNVYDPRMLRATLADGRTVLAYGFVSRRDHAQYAGRLLPAQAVALIRQGHGASGACRDYLANTVLHLRELGIRDMRLERLLAFADQAQPQSQP